MDNVLKIFESAQHVIYQSRFESKFGNVLHIIGFYTRIRKIEGICLLFVSIFQ